MFCHAQQNRLTVLERPKAMGIGPTWSALVQLTTRGPGLRWGWEVSSGPGPLTRPALEATRYAGRAVRLLSGPRFGARGAGHSGWPNTRYVINAVGKFNAQRRHRIDPVKDLCDRNSSGNLAIFTAIRRALVVVCEQFDRERHSPPLDPQKIGKPTRCGAHDK